MRKMNHRKWWILATIIWMAGIFCFTQLPYFTGENTSKSIQKIVVTEHKAVHTPSVDNGEIEWINFVIRKATHLTAFGILAFFLFKSLEIYRYSFVLSWVITFLYAATDEYHQSFMPGRTSSFKDVLIDGCGALIALSLTYLFRRGQTPRQLKD